MKKSNPDNRGISALNFLLLVLFWIVLDISAILAIPASGQESNSQQEKAVQHMAFEADSSKYTLNKKELLQLRKDVLLSELTLRRSSVDTHSNIKWQARLLFATFSVAFLFLCVTSSDFKKANIPKLQKFLIPFLFIGTFFLFDSHVSDLIDRTGDRVRIISDTLKDLPELSYISLIEIETYVDLSTKNNKLVNLWRKVSQIYKKPFDFVAFYFFVVLMWVTGWYFKEKIGFRKAKR